MNYDVDFITRCLTDNPPSRLYRRRYIARYSCPCSLALLLLIIIRRVKPLVAYLSALCSFVLSQAASANLLVDMSTLDCGARYLGSTTYFNVTITNTGQAAISHLTLSICGHKGAFRIVRGCKGTLLPANWCTATIAFVPLRIGQFHNHLSISGDEIVDGHTNSYSAKVKLEGRTVQ